MTFSTKMSNSTFSNLVRYSAWNFIALILPLLVGLVTIPYLLQQIGIERFGVLTIMWAIIGYFSLFDFGISKALTKKLAEGRANEDLQIQRKVFWTAIQLMFGLGILGWLVLMLLLLGLDNVLIKVSADIKDEVDKANLLIAFSIPLVVVSAGLRGSLEAYEKFRASNILRLILGVWMFLAPAIGSGLGYTSLTQMALILIVGRGIAAIASWFMVAHAMSGLGRPLFAKELVSPLFSFGAWITISGIVSPLMVYMDRFLIGATVSAASVAYYATPQDVATKLLFLPIAINAALLPVISKQLAIPINERADVEGLLIKSVWMGLICIAPFCAAMLMFPSELLTLWLGKDFAVQGSLVTQLFGIGVLTNAIGIVLISFLYASGQPSRVAKLHLVELPLYLIALYFALKEFGFVGAASVWILRVILDTAFLWYFTVNILPKMIKNTFKFFGSIGIFFALILSSAQINNLTNKLWLFLILCLITLHWAYWYFYRKPSKVPLA